MYAIIAASFGTLLVALLAFIVLFFSFSAPAFSDFFGRVQSLQVDDTVKAFREGGAAGAQEFLAHLNRGMGGTHYLVDESGRDVVSGADRSELLGPGPWSTPRRAAGGLVIVAPAKDAPFRLVIVAPPPPFSIWRFLPYYALILAAVAILGWLLAVGIVSPLRRVANAVDRFGRGDLAARAVVTRRDEIGTLAQSFDDMADRIQKLLTAERQLLQDISHELRSPLTRLSVGIELSRTAPDRVAAADRLQKEVDRLTALVGMLLEMTRAEGDPGARKSDRVDMQAVVQDVAQSCALEAAQRDCHIAVRTGTDGTVRGDKELLRRAFENVLRNAIRYAPPGTEVQVACEAQPAAIKVVVRDFGPGVPEDLLPRLTDPFFRVDSARDAKSGGVGLGLAIARRALMLHHGMLDLEQAHPGLRVILTIPQGAGATPAPA